MKISQIKIENFRSIRNAQIDASQFNIFVGQNNHGKTNLFEAVDWFYSGKGEIGKIRFGRSGDAEVSVEIEFIDCQGGLDKMKNERNRTSIKNAIGDQERVRIRRSSSDPKVRRIFQESSADWLEKNPAGFDTALNDFLPRFEYVSTEINPLEYAKYGRNTPISQMLSGVLTAILEGNEEYAAFRAKFDELFSAEGSDVRVKLDDLSGKVQVHLQKQFPECAKVIFEVSPPEFDDLLKSFDTSIDDGVHTDAREKGDGMQRALMLAILQTYCNFRREQGDEAGKQFLFFIDEGELHLHPTAQRSLKNALLEVAGAGDQIFLNTHSSVLVVDNHDNQQVFKVEKMGGATNVLPVSQVEKQAVVYELLGGSPADLLLPRNFLIVEGKCEVEFLTRVLLRHYANQPALQLVPADGDIVRARRAFAFITQAYSVLETSIYRHKLGIFVDRQNARNQLENFIAAYPELGLGGQILEAPVGSIEEYYPAPWRKSAGEAARMQAEEKLKLAREAGSDISREQFEQEMSDLHMSLQGVWARAFS